MPNDRRIAAHAVACAVWALCLTVLCGFSAPKEARQIQAPSKQYAPPDKTNISQLRNGGAHNPRDQAVNKEGTLHDSDDDKDLLTIDSVIRHWIHSMLWDPLVLFTFILATSTILLWRATQGLWRGAEAQAKDFKRSVKAMQDASRPHMVFDDFKIEMGRSSITVENSILHAPVLIGFRATNFGNAPAWLKKFCIGAQHGWGAEPPGPDWDSCINISIQQIIGPNGHVGKSIPEGPILKLEPDVRDSVVLGGRQILIYGQLEYSDAHGISHTNGFGYLFSPGATEESDKWTPVGDPPFELYRKYT